MGGGGETRVNRIKWLKERKQREVMEGELDGERGRCVLMGEETERFFCQSN